MSLDITETAALPQGEFLSLWKELSDDKEVKMDVPTRTVNVDTIKSKLAAGNLHLVAARKVPGKGDVLYLSSRYRAETVLLELTVSADVKGSAKSANELLARAALVAAGSILSK